MPGKITMRDAVPDDAVWLLANLRPADLAEAQAIHEDVGKGIRDAIRYSEMCAIAESEAHGGLFVIGCAEGETHGVPWLVGVNDVEHYPGALTKITKRYVASFLERWPVLLNYVDERNTVSVRWLRRLGFTIHEAREFGRNGERFHPFTMGLK